MITITKISQYTSSEIKTNCILLLDVTDHTTNTISWTKNSFLKTDSTQRTALLIFTSRTTENQSNNQQLITENTSYATSSPTHSTTSSVIVQTRLILKNHKTVNLTCTITQQSKRANGNLSRSTPDQNNLNQQKHTF